MNKTLDNFIGNCLNNLDSITSDRKLKLQQLISFIEKNKSKDSLSLIFICTHNSRRSFFTQVWAKVAADYFGFNHIETYSGGTSASEIFKETISALEFCGISKVKLSNNENPIYALKYNSNRQPIIGFSKVYDHSFNPSKKYAVIMTCGDADTNCPFIPEALERITLTYIDPKKYDNTDYQKEGYINKSKEIATEMLYIFNQLKHK